MIARLQFEDFRDGVIISWDGKTGNKAGYGDLYTFIFTYFVFDMLLGIQMVMQVVWLQV